MRIRTVKPEFWTHEGLAALPEFTRLMAIALLNYADDEGYFLASKYAIRGSLFPFLEDSGRITVALHELERNGFVQLGHLPDGRAVGLVVNFRKHQVINKPQPSKIKPCASFPYDSGSSTVALPEESGKTTVGNGMEGKGNGRETPAHASRSAPVSVEEAQQWAEGFSKGNTEMLVINPAWVAAWHDHRSATGWMLARNGIEMMVTDWHADLRMWCRNEIRTPSRPRRSSPQGTATGEKEKAARGPSPEPDWDWRALALALDGADLVGPWELQTGRTRTALRAAYAALSEAETARFAAKKEEGAAA